MIGPFDRAVLGILAACAALVALLAWRGDRVGVSVVALTPADGTLSASTASVIRVTFDDDLAADPAEPQPLAAEPAIRGSVVWEGRSVTLRPDQPLAPGTAYRVTLRAGLRGRHGRRLIRDVAWSFQTGETGVVFMARDADRLNQLVSVSPDGGPPTALTAEGPEGVWDFAVAPDGARVAYVAMRTDGGTDIVSIARTGGDRTVLLACPGAECGGPAWAPDGRALVYERRNVPPQAGPLGPPRLWWLDVGIGETAPVFADNQRLGFGARVSPDGRRLAYIAPDDGAVQIYDLQTDTQLALPSQMGEPAAWAPDGQSLVVADVKVVGESYVAHLHRVDLAAGAGDGRGDGAAAGSAEVRGGRDGGPQASQRDSATADSASPDDAAGSRFDLSGEGALVEDGSPAWSPDGRQIAFSRRLLEGADASPGKQLWLMNADGSGARQLVSDAPRHYGPPAWSPDGRQLLFQRLDLTNPGAEPVVCVLDIATGAVRELAAPGSQPAWVP